MFDEYFNPPSIVVTPVQDAAAPRVVVLADSPVSTSIDQECSSISNHQHRQEHFTFQGSSNSKRNWQSFLLCIYKKATQTDGHAPSSELVRVSKVLLNQTKEDYNVNKWKNLWVLKNKARLVAQGFRQEEGIIFEESFALVARIEDPLSS
ncbi:hypothetical protein Tco_0420507 [Tanacetum coccineum]